MYARTPAEVADLIQDLIKDKTVVELGTAEGEFTKAMYVHTKKITGYEAQTQRQLISVAQGFSVVNADYNKQQLADNVVYYTYQAAQDIDRLLKKIDTDNIHATFIIGQTSSYGTDKYLESIATEVRVACNGQFKVYILNT